MCNKCGAWKGELGLEPTPEMFIDHLCDIFDEHFTILVFPTRLISFYIAHMLAQYRAVNGPAFNSASFFDDPIPFAIFEFFNLTLILNIGLCFGPELSTNLYIGFVGNAMFKSPR